MAHVKNTEQEKQDENKYATYVCLDDARSPLLDNNDDDDIPPLVDLSSEDTDTTHEDPLVNNNNIHMDEVTEGLRTITLCYELMPENQGWYYGFSVYNRVQKQPLCKLQVVGPRDAQAQARIEVLRKMIQAYGPVKIITPPLSRKQERKRRQQHRTTALARLQQHKYQVTKNDYIAFREKTKQSVNPHELCLKYIKGGEIIPLIRSAMLRRRR